MEINEEEEISLSNQSGNIDDNMGVKNEGMCTQFDCWHIIIQNYPTL